MNNILTVITVHSIKSDTTHQLSKKMREEENRIENGKKKNQHNKTKPNK